jgi:hypothetical protein
MAYDTPPNPPEHYGICLPACMFGQQNIPSLPSLQFDFLVFFTFFGEKIVPEF